MSQKYYLNVWSKESKKLKETIKQDVQVTQGGPYEDRSQIKYKIGHLFIRYVKTANLLCDITDELRDPVARLAVRKIYELTLARALQLSDELSRLLAENKTSMDSLLIEHNVTPFDVELKIPAYFMEEQKEVLQYRKEWFENLRATILNEEVDKDIEEGEEEVEDKIMELLHKRSTVVSSRPEIRESECRDRSIISQDAHQKVVTNNENIHIMNERVAKEKNRKVQEMLRETYEVNCEEVSQKVRRKYTGRMEEDVEDELREWVAEFFSIAGDFPPFPPEETVYTTGQTYGVPKKLPKDFVAANFNGPLDTIPKTNFAKDFAGVSQLGGSALITAAQWIKPDEWLKCLANMKKKQGKQGKDSKKNKPTKTLKRTNKNSKAPGFSLRDTDYFSIMELVKENLMTLEKGLRNQEQAAQLNAFCTLGMEVRKYIDELVRLELELLKDALYKDIHPKKKRKKAKKKTSKKKGRKGKKDMTAGMTAEECMEDLVRNGVLKEGYGGGLNDFFADRSWAEQPETANGELTDVLLQRCILPLSSSNIHQLAPLTRSLCLVGLPNCGKRFLLDTVVTATGAALFDLSPAVTSLIYPGKKGLKMLMALVQRLSRELQPSIILVADIEKVFYQKVPKNERKSNPRRLQGALPKFVKGIKQADRVMVLATSCQPWLAKRKKLTKTCERFLYIPITHYGTLLTIWKRFLTDLNPLIEPSALAKISSRIGFTYSKIQKVATQGINGTNHPDPAEIVQAMTETPPTDEKIIKKFEKFISKTPMGVLKTKLKEEEKNASVKNKKTK